MKLKTLKRIGAILFAIGFILSLGTTGTIELDTACTLSFTRIVVQSVVSFIPLLLGVRILLYVEEREECEYDDEI